MDGRPGPGMKATKADRWRKRSGEWRKGRVRSSDERAEKVRVERRKRDGDQRKERESALEFALARAFISCLVLREELATKCGPSSCCHNQAGES